MAIETRRHDRALVIRTDHRLDGVNAPTFHDRLDAATVSAERAVVNGMGELTYISNAGLRVMPQTIRKTQERAPAWPCVPGRTTSGRCSRPAVSTG